TVGHDLLWRRALVLPPHLAALLEIDGALGLDVLSEALVLRHLGEVGLEVVHLAVGRLEAIDDGVELLGGDRGGHAHDEQEHEGTREQCAPDHLSSPRDERFGSKGDPLPGGEGNWWARITCPAWRGTRVRRGSRAASRPGRAR